MPFGDVIETAGRVSRWINGNTCRRFDDLAAIDVGEAGGRPLLSIFEANPRPLPLRIAGLERHPLSSQAFVPLQARPFLIVVALDGDAPLAHRLRAYVSSGHQGINYKRNTWHHGLIAIDVVTQFLVVDRGADDQNCDELAVHDTAIVVSVPGR
jgi:ureidoglycolate lyase